MNMISEPIKILVVEDHAMVRKGLRLMLDEIDGLFVIGEAPDGSRAVELVQRLEPDVVLMDLDMPVMDGVQAIRRIIALRPQQHIIVLSGYVEDTRLLQAISAGAQGYIGKTTDTEELVRAIRDVYSGRPSLDAKVAWRILHGAGNDASATQEEKRLTNRETEVLRLLSEGKPDKEIAEELVLTTVTIRTHISRILWKLNLDSRVQAALYAFRSGLVDLNDVHVLEEW
jgi:NarL family two-component system response regulator LiaR